MIDDTFECFMFIKSMKSPHGFVDIKVLQEFAAGPGIFREYHIATVQHTDGPESHIFKIPDRRGDDV